jgi:predicted PurR-regulated permease PerM
MPLLGPAAITAPLLESRSITSTAVVRAALIVLAIAGLGLALLRLSELLIVFAIAVVLAEGLRPAVEALQDRGINFELARLAVYVVLVAALVVVIAVLSRPVAVEARAVLAALPGYQADLQRGLDQLSLESSLSSAVSSTAAALAKSAFSLAAGIARGALDVVVVLLLSFLWLSAGPRLGAFVASVLPPSERALAAGMWTEIAGGFAGYVRGVVVNMVVIGVLTGVAAALLGLPAPALLGVLAGVTEMIPIAGPVIGAIPAILLGFTISPYFPLVVALVYLAIQQVEAHTLVPLVMRHAVGLPALAIVLALATGAALGGVGGAIVAVPLAFAGQVVILRAVAPAIRRYNQAAS